MDAIALLFTLMLERPPMPTVLLSMQMATEPKCNEVVEGCLRWTLPTPTCVEAPPGGCINQPCTFIKTCEPSGPRKPRPAPEPMVAEGRP